MWVGARLTATVVADSEELHTQAFFGFVVLRLLGEDRAMRKACGAPSVGVVREETQGFAAFNVDFVSEPLFLGSTSN